MKALELFGGSCSFSNEVKKLGHQTFTSDFKDFENINYVCDILDFDISRIPFQPDIVWASPPCTYFSVASIGHHWNKDHTPKTSQAILGCVIVKKTLEIIEALNPKFFFIENPRGKLRKLDFMQKYKRHTVTYCQYGDTRMKPTDIWTNSDLWFPKPICKNGDPCHIKAPRGSQTGTQGLKGNYLRSVVPKQLCLEIIKSCIN